jgi:NDP-sugar pyrophosphorylase family protein
MQAVIMAGGKGTRLKPYTFILPKPLVPVGDMAILEVVLLQLRYYGFTNVIVSVGYKAELIMAILGNGARFKMDVTYFQEEKPLGTLGSLAYMDNLEPHFVVMNGDVVTSLNFRDLYEDHVRSGAVATVSTWLKHEKLELGVLTVDESTHAITGFQEKPTHDFLVAIGVNAFSRSVVDSIPRGAYFGFDDFMHQSLRDKTDVRTRLFRGLWNDIGRLDDYERMQQEFHNNRTAYLPKGSEL